MLIRYAPLCVDCYHGKGHYREPSLCLDVGQSSTCPFGVGSRVPSSQIGSHGVIGHDTAGDDGDAVWGRGVCNVVGARAAPGPQADHPLATHLLQGNRPTQLDQFIRDIQHFKRKI